MFEITYSANWESKLIYIRYMCIAFLSNSLLCKKRILYTQHFCSDYSGDEIDSEAGLVTCGKLILNPSTITASSNNITPATEPLYENFPHPIAGIESMEALTKSEEDLLEKIAANPIPDLDTDWDDPEGEDDPKKAVTNTDISIEQVCEEVPSVERSEKSKLAGAPVVDIVVVEKVGVDSLDMFSRMIELGDSGENTKYLLSYTED